MQATSSDDDDEPIGDVRRGGISQMGGLRAHSGNLGRLYAYTVRCKEVVIRDGRQLNFSSAFLH